MKIALASDHARFTLKEALRARIESAGYSVLDFGIDSSKSVDYPDVIAPAAQCVPEGKADLGIVLGGSGNGEAMVANKFPGVRCAVCWNEESARLAKEHNNANVIAIGARLVNRRMAIEIVDTWLTVEFQGGRHLRRIRKIDQFTPTR